MDKMIPAQLVGLGVCWSVFWVWLSHNNTGWFVDELGLVVGLDVILLRSRGETSTYCSEECWDSEVFSGALFVDGRVTDGVDTDIASQEAVVGVVPETGSGFMTNDWVGGETDGVDDTTGLGVDDAGADCNVSKETVAEDGEVDVLVVGTPAASESRFICCDLESQEDCLVGMRWL